MLAIVAEVRGFCGTYLDYSGREYVAKCKDVMLNSYMSDSADKISSLQLLLKPGSRAAHLICVSVFTKPLEKKDYEQFKLNFLGAFGSNLKHSQVKCVSNVVQTFKNCCFSCRASNFLHARCNCIVVVKSMLISHEVR